MFENLENLLTGFILSQLFALSRWFFRLFVYGMLLIAILHFSIFYLAVNIDSFFMAFKDQNRTWKISSSGCFAI